MKKFFPLQNREYYERSELCSFFSKINFRAKNQNCKLFHLSTKIQILDKNENNFEFLNLIMFCIISHTVYSKVECNRKFNNLNRKMLLSKPQGRKNLAGHALSIRLVRVLTRIL